jgi:DNA-binding transcriptional LysR family regulator
MEIRHLKYMLAVAEEGHFNMAAKRLHVAQPALSHNIRQLEAEIGTQLFARTTRSVSLTEAGRVFYHEAYKALDQMESVMRSARMASSGEEGTVTIGFTATSIYGPLRGTIRRFHRRYPEVQIITRECSARSLLDQLHDGEMDVACSEDCIPNANFQMKQYPPTYVVVAIHKQHRLAQEKGPIKIKELADEPIIFPTQNTTRGVYENFSRALAKAGVRPRYEYSADNATSGIPLVAAGLGVCLVPEFTQLLHSEVIYRRIISPSIRQFPQLIWRKDRVPVTLTNFISFA